MNQPLISVVMPVYNAGDFLVESIQSILNQTYTNFEFIIVDDASTDDSWEIMKKFKTQGIRVKIFHLKNNVGVSQTVKFAIEKAKGIFLARMDADDIAHPKRLEKQINYLLKNKETVAIGTQCKLINKKGVTIGEKVFPTKFEDIYKYIFTFIPVQQPTLMVNRKLLPKDFEFYYDRMDTAEEVELIFKLFKYGKVENLNQKLHRYRIHDQNTSLKNLKKTFLLTLMSRIKAVYKYNYKPTIFGFISTLFQALIVLVLPAKLILRVYWFLKELNYKKRVLQKFFYYKPLRRVVIQLRSVFTLY